MTTDYCKSPMVWTLRHSQAHVFQGVLLESETVHDTKEMLAAFLSLMNSHFKTDFFFWKCMVKKPHNSTGITEVTVITMLSANVSQAASGPTSD